jgi:hypothetical protein
MVIKILPVFSILIDYLEPHYLITLVLINKKTKEYINYYTKNIGYKDL